MNEEKKDGKPDRGSMEVEEFKGLASQPPPDAPKSESSGLRGCGIAVGIAALVFLFVVGTCFL